jgi:hypothetical protein
MGRLLALLLVGAVLAVPTVAAASTSGPAADGTLSVRNGKGLVGIAARGGVVARWDRGCGRVVDPKPEDGTGPVVFGADRYYEVSERTAVYCGTNVRLRLIGGFFRLKVTGTDIDLSLVGRGSVSLGPAATIQETGGTYSIDGTDYRPFPDVLRTFQLGTLPGI